MSNWDFGHERQPTERHEPGQPGQPGQPEWPGGDGEPDDFETVPYPLTYERDDDVEPAAAPHQPWPAPPDPVGRPRPDLFGRERYVVRQPAGEPLGDQQWPQRRAASDRRPRWLILTGVAVAGAAIGVAAVMLADGHPGRPTAAGATAPAKTTTPPGTPNASASAAASPSPSPAATAHPPLTMAEAQGVLAGYTTVNNDANAKRSDAELATAETGGSYAIDAGVYQMQQAAGTKPFPAFEPVTATYYIPGDEPATGPRWFVAQVGNAFLTSQKKVSSTEYLLFTQAVPGGPWKDAIEPYLLPAGTGSGTGSVSAPRIAVGSDGFATSDSLTATSLAAEPGQLASLTAASLDGIGSGVAVTDSGDLTDIYDQKFWTGKVPTATITDTHAPASGTAGQAYALRTTDGGALVFYTDSAAVTITAPADATLSLSIPGFYSPAQKLNSAGLTYLDQFAAYDPPVGATATTPQVVAEYSGITGKN